MQAIIHILEARHRASCPICGYGSEHRFAYPRVAEVPRPQDAAERLGAPAAKPAEIGTVPD